MKALTSRLWRRSLHNWFLKRFEGKSKRRANRRPAPFQATGFSETQILETRTLLTAGSLDPTFGDGGKVLTDIVARGSNDYGQDAIAYQSNGKSIVVGTTNNDMFAVRYNIDGSLDTTFGVNGTVKIDFGGTNDTGLSVAVDSLDRILVAGHAFNGLITNPTRYDFAVARLTSDGSLDVTFDGDGKQTFDFGGPSDFGHGVAVDSQDRVLVGGYSYQGPLTGFDFVAVRLTTTGALDTGFDTDGVQIIDLGSLNDYAYGVAVDSQDRLLIAGFTEPAGLQEDFAVVRLTVSGGLDTNFDGDGIQTIDFGGGVDVAWDVAVDSADRVLLGGYSNPGTGNDFAVARLDVFGSLDTGFDGDGRQTIDFGTNLDYGYAVAVDSLDRVLVAGEAYQPITNGRDFGVARLTTNGALDTDFDTDGKQTIDFGSNWDFGQGVAVDATDRVLVIGHSNQFQPTNRDVAVTRLTEAGQLDASFDSDGKVITDIGRSVRDLGRDVVAYQSDGKTIVVGDSFGDMIAVRYNTDGSLDSTFGTNGIVRIDFGSSDIGYSVAIDSQNRILVGGYSYQGATGNDFAVARLMPNGSLDLSFDGDGKQTIDFGSSSDLGHSVAVDGADRVLIAGRTFQSGTGADFAVARLTSAGLLDTDFSGDGRLTIDFGSSSDSGFSVAVDSEDRVVIAGATSSNFAVVRITDMGVLDTSFSGDGKQTVNFGGGDFAESVAIDSTDRVLIAGHSTLGSTATTDFAVARLTSLGELDTDFGSGGKQTIDFGGMNDEAQSVVVDNAGYIVVAGHSYQGAITGNDFAVVRLTDSGNLDAGFDGDGKQTIDFGSTSDVGFSVAVDSSNRVLVAGYSFRGEGKAGHYDFAVARLLSNEPPIANDGQFNVEENSAIGTSVGAVTASDPNGDTLAYTIISGNDGGTFAIDSASGQITVADSTLLDYESRQSFTLEVLVSDGNGGTDTATITIDILNQASITGTVFVDINQNGLYEANEMAIEGVAIELLNDHDEVVASTITSEGGYYLFEDFAPGTYRLREVQPTGVSDGAEILGSLGGTIVANDVIEFVLARLDGSDYDFAEIGQQVSSGDTATIGFWQNKHGQNLISQGGTALAQWLTDNFSNVFGTTFQGGTGDDVAAFYKDQLFKQKAKKSAAGPAKVDAQFMAVAFATFFTSRNLAGDVAASFGFNVTDTGIGTNVVNVAENGAAFDVPDNTDMTIMQLLTATDSLTDIPDAVDDFAHIYDRNGDGVIDAEEESLRVMANQVFSSINEQGAI